VLPGRTSGRTADGRETARPAQEPGLLPTAHDSGGGLHPGDAGDAATAGAVNLATTGAVDPATLDGDR